MTKQRLLLPPTGGLAWKCLLPLEGFESPGATELRIGSTGLKYVIAVRTLQIELGCGVGSKRPTPIFTDSKTIIDGTDCKRLVRLPRWGLACGTITLDKVLGESNLADLTTKPTTGSRFIALRARVLGLSN